MEHNVTKQCLRAVVLMFVVLLLAGVSADETDKISVANFSEGDLSGWEEKSFKENSQYEFVSSETINSKNVDVGFQQARVLRARTQGQASGLFKEVTINLDETPFLNWSWQVNTLFKGNDERSKEGDDYPARIYVLVSGGVFFWNTKAINYVWSSNQPVGSEWPNAYTGNAQMLAVQSGDKKIGQWVSERRNIREDFQKLFGDDVTQIDAVAVMIDGDNTGQSATSYFGDIFFSKY